MCYCPSPTLHLNLALTGDGAFLFSLKKTHSVWFISVLNYGDTENVLINHLLLVIPMSYPCHYTNLCPHKPHKHAPPPTHTQSNPVSSLPDPKTSHTRIWLHAYFYGSLFPSLNNKKKKLIASLSHISDFFCRNCKFISRQNCEIESQLIFLYYSVAETGFHIFLVSYWSDYFVYTTLSKQIQIELRSSSVGLI